MEWHVHKQIGSGSYGNVHLVRNKKNEFCALKTSPCFEQGQILQGTLRELFFYTTFDPSPHVCKSLGHWKLGDKSYIVMPLYACTLETIYSHFQTTIPYNDYLRLFLQAVKGLREIHKQGFIHRDIKPENILVNSTGLCIADFNLIRWAGGASTHDTLVPDESRKNSSDDSLTLSPNSVSSQSPESFLDSETPETPSILCEKATTYVCTLWTRAPELVYSLIRREKRCTYSYEIDVFSLGCTFLAFAAGDYVIGKACSLEKTNEEKVEGVEGVNTNSKEYRYLYGFLNEFGINPDIRTSYENAQSQRDWNSSPAFVYEYIKKQLLWNAEQSLFISKLLATLLHPIPSKRAKLHTVQRALEQALANQSLDFSVSLKDFIERKEKKLILSKTSSHSIVMSQLLPSLPPQQEFSAVQFWSLCSSNFIQPYIACEVMRLKQALPLNLSFSKALLYLLDTVHEFQVKENFKLFSGIDSEHVYLLCLLVKPQKKTLDLVIKLSSTPFLVCCLAAELAFSGYCTEEEVKKSKIMHLATAKPFFDAYGYSWKSQHSLRSTWSRLES
jgi:serine/threonine protein kinase